MPTDADRRPNLAASNLHERVREAAFALHLTEHRPIAPAELAQQVGVPEAGLAPMLDELAGTPTVLLWSTEHATIWSERHGALGQVLDLAEGADLGAEAWAACATAAAVLTGRA